MRSGSGRNRLLVTRRGHFIPSPERSVRDTNLFMYSITQRSFIVIEDFLSLTVMLRWHHTFITPRHSLIFIFPVVQLNNLIHTVDAYPLNNNI